jgi:hypothetical protein
VAPDQDKCLTGCILEHEQCHVSDVRAYGGKPCKGKPKGTIVSWPGVGASELKCGSAEIDCLIKQLAKIKPCDECVPRIEKRLKRIWNYTGGANK